MCNFRLALSLILMAVPTFIADAAEPVRDYPIRPVPAHVVQFRDAFWSPRIEVNRTATIPLSFQMCEETGRIENFKVAAGTSDKNWVGKFGFNDSDVYKVMEGAAYSLMTRRDPRSKAYLDELVGYIAAAQEGDGYLCTAWSARDGLDEKQLVCCYPREGTRWLSLRDSHELYNVGHMYEAAVAHWQATGDKAFLNVAIKNADLLVDTFAPGKTEIPSGHPEIELALVKLYRATGEERYLKLAKFLIDIRGKPSDERPLWGEYTQDHEPLVEQAEAVGHAVRAMYLYAAATDIAAVTDDRELARVVDRLWDSVFTKKAYITGGIGSTARGEAFGTDYELPNDTAYSETCANLATCFWNHRMFLLHGDAKYIDMLERSIYNSTISGVALDGKSFFYPNPLASTGNYARSKWFDCACCPTNICRFVPSIPGYAYATADDALYVNLFVAGSADVEFGGSKVRVEQETNYPWDGRVVVRLSPETAGQRFALKVRIPGWARDEPFASDLYRYLDESNEQPSLQVGGERVTADIVDGFATIERAWHPGDTVTLDLPMPVRRVVAHEKVAADRGRAALMRGPIVYCIEWPDVHGGQVNNLVLPDDKELQSEYRADLLGGVQVINGVVRRVRQVTEQTHPANNEGKTSKQIAIMEELEATAIPYYAWAHRGPGEMAVWLARTPNVLAQPPADDRQP